MNRSMIVLSMFAVLTVAACSHGGSWTPMEAGRTAGKGSVEYTQTKGKKADKAFSQSLRK